VKALILAGGFGTRLRPLTYTRPKHLLPIANRPHIEHVFRMLRRCDVREVVLLTSYLAEAFTDAIGDATELGLSVEVVHEEEPLGTAGALRNAKDAVGDSAFLAFNGDVLTDVDLTAVIDWHRSKEAEATILLTPVDDPSAFGVVPTAPDGRVLEFIEKPDPGHAPTNFINAGVYVMESRVLDRIPPGEVHSSEMQLFPGMVAGGAALFALGTDAYWMDIGTPAKYLQANLDALAGRFVTDAVAEPGPDAALIAAGASVHRTATVTSACVGSGATVEAGAVVHRSVLLPGAIVGRGARVSGTVLGERSRVVGGDEVMSTAVADGETVSNGRL
jgi:mannose-1-phosphate guanylyltransferase